METQPIHRALRAAALFFIFAALALSACAKPAPLPPLPSVTQTDLERALSSYQTGIQALEGADYYKLEGTGSVENPLSSQAVVTSFIKDGAETLNTSYSSGFVNGATEIHATRRTVTVRQGKYKNGTPTYKTTTVYTPQEFSAEWGGQANLPWCYDIREETVLSAEYGEEEGVSTFTLYLDPESAVEEYCLRMMKNGDIKRPTFSAIILIFTLENGRFTSFTVQESYTVKILVNVSCQATLNQTFTYEK